jgi:hypothetical protein
MMEYNNYLTALALTYKAEVAAAEANLNNLINNKVGVADHPDLIKSLDDCITTIVEAKSKLEVLEQEYIK